MVVARGSGMVMAAADVVVVADSDGRGSRCFDSGGSGMVAATLAAATVAAAAVATSVAAEAMAAMVAVAAAKLCWGPWPQWP